jgi:hypothetical protein
MVRHNYQYRHYKKPLHSVISALRHADHVSQIVETASCVNSPFLREGLDRSQSVARRIPPTGKTRAVVRSHVTAAQIAEAKKRAAECLRAKADICAASDEHGRSGQDNPDFSELTELCINLD